MLFKKITGGGVVIQTFNDAGECIKQEFKICDHGDVEYETEDGDPINMVNMPLGGDEYFPFDMVQPNDPLAELLRITARFKPQMTDDELRAWTRLAGG